MNNSNEDVFLKLFSASMSEKKDQDDIVFEIELKISEPVIAEIRIPESLLADAEALLVGQLIIERILVDLAEGVVEALHRAHPARFDDYATYLERESAT